jgi:hypothetical protein
MMGKNKQRTSSNDGEEQAKNDRRARVTDAKLVD